MNKNINLEKLFQEVMIILANDQVELMNLRNLEVEIVFPENYINKNNYHSEKYLSLKYFWKSKKKYKGKLVKDTYSFKGANQDFPETIKLMEYGIEQKNNGKVFERKKSWRKK